MFQINWGDLTPALFLKEYWQKKPLLIKNAFPDFEDPIDANELAGLAMEEEIQSRLVAEPTDNNWVVQHGPFSDFSEHGENRWTLLVQAVNNWSAETDKLLQCFNFMPTWRLDDIMVSFSTPQGGVGPHLDQYDVFIVQGAGKRHWQVGAPDSSLSTVIPHPDLKQVSPFTPVIDAITEPGDLLYIPPNHPHNGSAIDNSLNYSIGFQAPNNQELLSGFADKLLDNDLGKLRFPDPDRQTTAKPHIISNTDINALKHHMIEELNNDDLFDQFIGEQLTHCQHALELLPPEEPLTVEEFATIIQSEEVTLKPVLGIKALITESSTDKLYICGETLLIDEECIPLSTLIANKEIIDYLHLKSASSSLKNMSLLTSILNKGFWYIE